MAGDIFGCAVLFEEFEKDRISSDSFIQDNANDPKQTGKHIIFSLGDSESSNDSWPDIENEKKSDYDEPDQTVAEPDSGNQVEKQSCEIDSNDQSNGIAQNGNINSSATARKEIPARTPTNYQVLHERNKFKKFAALIDSTRHVPDEDSPAVQVIFQNNDFARKYRKHIEEFITSLIGHEMRETHLRKPEFPIKSSVLTCVDLNNKLPAELRNDGMWKAHAIVGNAQFHKNFLVDTLGWPLVNLDPGMTEGWYAPMYSLNYTEPIPVEEEPMGPAKKSQRQKQSCFNCGGDHRISDCQLPRDMQRINENKRNFMAQRSPMQKGSRYHKDDQIEVQRFQPGKISTDLQEALGISDKELPLYIYKMRELGYPPGWLKEAEHVTSGLVLFDKDGREVSLRGDKMEEGEVKDAIPFEDKVNLEKIIEYPGFTVESPKDVIDLSQKLGMPTLQHHQLKSTLMSQVKNTSEKQKRKAQIEEEAEMKKLRMMNKEEDMDLDDEDAENLNESIENKFVPPLPLQTPPGQPPLPDGTPPRTPGSNYTYPPTLGNLTPESSPAATPKHSLSMEENEEISLEDLEDQYKLIKQKLAENEDADVSVQVIDDVEKAGDNNSNASFGSPVQNLSREDSMTSIKSFGELGTGSPDNSSQQSPGSTPISFYSNINFSFKGTVSVDKEYGTPIVKRKDSYDSLPVTSNFGVGITDHLNFENLPDSTGSFLRLRGLIGKIRSKVSTNKKKSLDVM
ncbi:hypothetical protein ScPMuIL_006289 [Solemya velum]